jgi:hypothetical protein
MLLKEIYLVGEMTSPGEISTSSDFLPSPFLPPLSPLLSVKARFARNKERKEEKKIDRIRFVISEVNICPNVTPFFLLCPSLVSFRRELHERDQERQRNFMSQLGVDFSQG